MDWALLYCYSSGGIQNAGKVLFFLSQEKVESGWAGGAGCNTSVVRLWQEALPLSWLCGDAQAPPAGLSALPKGPEMSPCVEPFLSAGNRWDEVPWRGVDGGGGGLF